jgi:hypothetical protein
VAQTIYAHVNKCKNDKIRKELKSSYYDGEGKSNECTL